MLSTFLVYTIVETNLCLAQRRYASEQTRRAYTALNEQFDTYTGVIWQPYTKAARISRYPGGISVLCTRDRGYWMTKSKIIFDVFVEEMAQQRIMRQFGLRQLAPPPNTENLLSVVVHRYVILTIYYILFLYGLWLNIIINYRMTRKGTNRTRAQWLQRLEEYVLEWETATERRWHEQQAFDFAEYNAYLEGYMRGTRLSIVQHSNTDEIPDPHTSDTYPTYDTSRSRQYAVIFIIFTSFKLLLLASSSVLIILNDNFRVSWHTVFILT